MSRHYEIRGTFTGEDERALGAQGGMAEKQAQIRMMGDDLSPDQLEELRIRAEAGDERAKKILEKHRQGASNTR